ncbi:MAG: RdgB/HAM1 family non-canonical purine NTP pyrophosphatase [Clostridia bacterium]|nr:RdgB/HAM1 family non-canonical purine NTP pyrophosphatase [Clostridia bacterium]
MKIVLASRNRHKIAEIERVLGECGVNDVTLLSLDDIGFDGEIEETGTTFEENAYIKACVPAKMGYFAIADDSGLTVEALGGRPGVYSARYAGEPCNDKNNNDKLLRELENVPDGKRGAAFISVIAFVDPNKIDEPHYFRGEFNGEMIREERGNGGFGYDPIFYMPQLSKTYAEITIDEKNEVSHRGQSIRLFAKYLTENKQR